MYAWARQEQVNYSESELILTMYSTEYPRKGIDTDAILSVRVYMWENDYTMYAWLEEVNNDGELGRRRLIIKS